MLNAFETDRQSPPCLPIEGMFAIPGEFHPGNEVTQAEVFIRIAKANHVRAEERHRLVTNMYLPWLEPDVSSPYILHPWRRAYLRLPTRARLTNQRVHVPTYLPVVSACIRVPVATITIRSPRDQRCYLCAGDLSFYEEDCIYHFFFSREIPHSLL